MRAGGRVGKQGEGCRWEVRRCMRRRWWPGTRAHACGRRAVGRGLGGRAAGRDGGLGGRAASRARVRMLQGGRGGAGPALTARKRADTHTPSVLRGVWMKCTSSAPSSSWHVLPHFSSVGRKAAGGRSAACTAACVPVRHGPRRLLLLLCTACSCCCCRTFLQHAQPLLRERGLETHRRSAGARLKCRGSPPLALDHMAGTRGGVSRGPGGPGRRGPARGGAGRAARLRARAAGDASWRVCAGQGGRMQAEAG